MLVVLNRHFPTLIEDLSKLWDYRLDPTYPVQEIYMACISMFLFKRGSRNAMNNTSEKCFFRENYKKLFGLKLPHMDTVNLFMEKCDPQDLENIKQKMIQCLINKKALQKFLLNGKYVIAVDATGIGYYNYEPWPGCPYKEYKSGKVWQVPVLEAKLVCCNGLSLSVCTQWILNTGDYQKQSCEQTEFVDLAVKLKKQFPRLPIVIAADGLYPNNTTFTICQKNNWGYIITLKEGNLKTLWDDIDWKLRMAKDNTQYKILLNKPGNKVEQNFRFLNDQQYGSHSLNWIECKEKTTLDGKTTEVRFVYVTNIKATKENIFELCRHARQRWNIENEGFDQQKNHGYAMKHKFSRKSLMARQNYYQCMQIAHIINQLVEKVKSYVGQLHSKESMELLWDCMIAFMWLIDIEAQFINEIKNSNCQLRY